MDTDKNTECLRYDARARSLLASGNSRVETVPAFGSSAIPPILRAPYVYYEQCIRRFVCKHHEVIELGCGTGMHTHVLVQTGARVVASDISSLSLKVLSQLLGGGVTTRVADMESLPFEAGSFDVVAMAGSMSYGDPGKVDAEIRRVLRPGGMFICVDSLNHNPIYRINRWVQNLQGIRTKSTFLRIPTMARIQTIAKEFESVEVRFFGAVSFLMPLLAFMIGQFRAAEVSDAIDRFVNVRRSAFKFVMVARGRL